MGIFVSDFRYFYFTLHKQKQEAEMKQIMEAYHQSGRSFDEVMIFLGG